MMSRILFNKKLIGILSAVCFTSGFSYGQISGTKTVGIGGNYPNLTGATGLFHAINASGLNGDLNAVIISDIIEPATDSLIDYSAGGTNSYRVAIKPDAAVLRNITSTSAASMVIFNNVRNLTIDGSFNASGNYLRFSNDNSGNNAGAIKFANGCNTDTVKNCILENSSASTLPANNSQKAATVLLEASVAGTVSNANLVFANNIFQNITGAANFPCSHLRGIDGTTGINNDAIIVSGNQFINSRIESIRTGSNTSSNAQLGWTITGNSIYATTNTATVAGTTKKGIVVTRSSGCKIMNNYIGGSGPNATGTYPTIGPFTCISIETASNPFISNNTISNIKITLAAPAASGGLLVGIEMKGLSGTASNNTISNLNTNGCNVYGINITGSTDTAQNNTIRNLSSTFKNITSSTQKNAIGISISGGNSYHYIANNTIDSISGYSNYSQYAAAPTGIYVGSMTASGSTPTIVEANTITNIGNLDTATALARCASVSGITVASNVTIQPLFVNRNYISNIYGVNLSAFGNNIAGILDFSASASTAVCTNTYANNVIVLGSNPASIPSRAWVSGIQIGSTLAATFNFNNNTISIPATISLNSNIDSFNKAGASCIARLNNLPIVNLQNNLLSNLAQNSGNGAVAAVNFMTDASGGAITSNYNVYNVVNPNTVIADQGTGYSLSNWRALKLIDSSTTVAPSIPFTSASDLHIITNVPDAWNVYGRGIANSSVVTDKDGNTRSIIVGKPTTVGAYEIATPNSTPADMTMIPATPVVGTPTEFWSNGRKIAEVNWTAGATMPTTFSGKFYPGVVAPFLDYLPKVNAYFDINEAGFAGSYTIKLYVNQAEGAGQAYSSLRAAKIHGTDPYTFIANAGSNSIDANGNYLLSSAQTTFSSFGMTSGITPLDIRLKEIKAANLGLDNKITWTTVAEAKGDIFQLQSSRDAKSFETIATITVSGKPKAYDYYDRNVNQGVTYYRLKLNAIDGLSIYSDIVNAVVTTKGSKNFAIMPNPTFDVINVRSTKATGNLLLIELSDISGRVIKSVKSNEANTVIDMKPLPAGTYLVKVVDGQNVSVEKVIKQ